MTSPRIALLALALFSVVTLVTLACDEERGCRADIDCGVGRLCSVPTGQCVECLDSTDCDDGGFCCQGSCREGAELSSLCGCQARPDGEGGVPCTGDTPVCLTGGVPATPTDIAGGTCGCDCDAARGGSLCLGVESGESICGCSGSDDVGTCGRPVLDENGLPHVVADLCAPSGGCVCFGAEQVCDPNSSTPDCNSGGCFSLLADPNNCGQAGKVCTSGNCIEGGCGCSAPGDCTGNTDLCVLDQVAQCVCANYRANDQPAPCPLGLDCDDGGCAFDGDHYTTAEELYPALGLALP